MRRNNMDETVERVMALPEFILSKEDDIAKAADFSLRFVDIMNFSRMPPKRKRATPARYKDVYTRTTNKRPRRVDETPLG